MKKLLLVFLLFASSQVFSQSYEKNLDCDVSALTQYLNDNRSQCSQLKGKENTSCEVGVLRKLSYSACSPTIQSSARNLIFLKEEVDVVTDLFSAKKINLDTTLEKIDRLNELIKDEKAYMKSSTLKYYDAQEAQIAQQRSNRVINNALSILGGYTQSTNASKITTDNYVINGRMITCVQNGNVTTCN